MKTRRTRPPRNLHLCLANAAQGDIVVTMKPPSPRCSPSHPSIHTPTQRCHVRVSHSNFCLEPDARNFANSDHAYITARLTKKILSAFFHCIFFLLFFYPSLFLSLSFSPLFFFFLVLVFELSLRTPDNAKILLKQSREHRPKLAPEKIQMQMTAPRRSKLFNFEFSLPTRIQFPIGSKQLAR